MKLLAHWTVGNASLTAISSALVELQAFFSACLIMKLQR
jgi:hypothetical protein